MEKIFFNLNNANDLLEKCTYEFLQISDEVDNNCNIYKIFNVILSLNHLLEWFLKDKFYSDDLKTLCVKKFFPYNKFNQSIDNSIFSIIKKMKIEDYSFQTNNKQKIIREISNNLKHINFNIDTSVKKSFINVCGDGVCCCEDNRYAGDFDKYIFTVNDKGKLIDLLKLINELIIEWKHFFNTSVE